MAELITCPNCKKQLQVPESQLGSIVRCPECQHTFTADSMSVSETPIPTPSSKTPISDDGADDQPRRRRHYDDDEDDDRDYREDYDVRRHADIPTYMTQAILVTLCCCWPFGIVAIVMASRVTSALSRGDVEAAMRASQDAKMWCWISFVLGLIVTGIWFAINIAVENPNF